MWENYVRTTTRTAEGGFLRQAQIGMGFSFGRYGPKPVVRRFKLLPIFAYQKEEKKGLLGRIFG